MSIIAKALLLVTFVVFAMSCFGQETAATTSGPQYTGNAELVFPEHYREWTYVTSGYDMSYSADAQMGDHHMFDNVFVNPDAYRAFVKTGTWPDKTMLVLEHRVAKNHGSINRQGGFQTGLMDVEVHVKDAARFGGKWGFFSFADGGKTSAMIPRAASCYACHQMHAAVNTTFVQFYPTLLPIAEQHGTLRHAYENDVRAAAQK